ncbi:hypothetical protein FA15DRAFT_42706 [Coprinopsis marcescibilis]|uniref:Uncharacterized protein n=1 Tax=Coprinopsis marcescibilis TaxID=230819 RepID=A0A5C3LIY0_COPMA|nr:hypothetical protein FA15DRAFT_42706 [Coprinopsis marcescibilis]
MLVLYIPRVNARLYPLPTCVKHPKMIGCHGPLIPFFLFGVWVPILSTRKLKMVVYFLVPNLYRSFYHPRPPAHPTQHYITNRKHTVDGLAVLGNDRTAMTRMCSHHLTMSFSYRLPCYRGLPASGSRTDTDSLRYYIYRRPHTRSLHLPFI